MRLAPRTRLPSAVLMLALMASTAPLAAAQSDVEFPNACREVDENDAIAYGYGNPLTVLLNGESIEPALLETGVAEARQVGPGKSGDRTAFLDLAIPDEEDPLVHAQILSARVDLDVDNATEGLESEAWVNTKLVGLNVLDGLITADIVRAFAYARSDVRSASTYTDPSTIVNLQVRGLATVDVSPGANVTLPAFLFGAGSYISVYERSDNSRRPTPEDPYWVADVRVRMLHIHITQFLLGSIDIIVSESYARAQSPTPFCGVAQSVEGGAYNVRIREGLESPGILVGEQHIGVTGGSAHQQLLGVNLLDGVVMLNVSETDVNGTIVAGEYSESDAMGQVLGLCIMLNPDDEECFVEAVLVRAEAHCYADADGAWCTGNTTILKLVVDGVDVCASLNLEGTCTPAPSTRIPLGPITVILNEQERVDEGGFASIHVRAIRIETPIDLVGTIIISRAMASAGYEDVSPNESPDRWEL